MGFIDIEDISKRFGATRALQGVSLTLERGEIHGLLGENGAGKSTLMKVLSGVVAPDTGSVTVDGHVMPLGDPRASRRAGIGIAFQELSSPPDISVAMKLCLRDAPHNALGMISQRKLLRKATAILAEYDASHIPASALISEIDLATKQQIEIIAAMRDATTLLVLDEPTAALPDTEWLFARMREIAARGAGIIYISHKLKEIEEVCRRGTVIRNGRVVGDFVSGQVTESRLVELMIGRSFEHAFPDKPEREADAVQPLVRVTDLSSGKARGVSFSMYPGEILGVAALEGQGQRDLFYTLAGMQQPTGGRIDIDASAARCATALVPEERKTEALFLELSSTFNLTVSTLGAFSSLGVTSPKRERTIARQRASDVKLPHPMLEKAVGSLSGGNQQKVVFGRALSQEPACLILFDPTRGVDVPTKVELYALIRSYARSGRTVLMYSTEIPELVGLCDRVLTMHNGRLSGEFTGSLIDESNVMTGALNLRTVEEGAAR
ncbi:sugar ABC transporter ATP-binding protein [Microbacterium sp. NPDC096154]|uniref:sugar ABC transporter ATP-binding protein n=1 Tax=Microbacterium sp. NPDC096154 TaxID=3155549 RepID=UPI00332A335E